MWTDYERRKKRIQQENLTPAEYERRVQEILKEIERNANEYFSPITR